MKKVISLFGQLIVIYWCPVLAINATFGQRHELDSVLVSIRPHQELSVLQSADNTFWIRSIPQSSQREKYILFYNTSIHEYEKADYISQIRITSIEAIDHHPAGKGGYAAVKRGGVGAQHVRMFLQSRRGVPLNFTINIYGCKTMLCYYKAWITH